MPKKKNWSKVEDEELPEDVGVSWEHDNSPQVIFIRRFPVMPSLGDERDSEVLYATMISDKVTSEPKQLFSESNNWNELYEKTTEWLEDHPEGSEERMKKIEESN